MQHEKALIPTGDFGLEFPAVRFKQQNTAGFGRLAGPYLGHGGVFTGDPFQQHFNLAAGDLAAEQPCWNDPGIVEHHEIFRLQLAKQVRKLSVCHRTGLAIQTEEATVRTMGRRIMGDQRVWQIEMKVAELQERYRSGNRVTL